MEEAGSGNRKTSDRVYTVGLEGMEFTAFHGCREDEKIRGNCFIVNFKGWYRSSCGQSDDILDAVNYGQIYRTVAAVMQGESVNLLETLASRIADSVAAEFPAVFRMEVNVRKKNPPVAGPCLWSDVTVKWEKDA